MSFEYPKVSNCLVYKKHNEEFVEITDYLTDEVYYLEKEAAEYIKKLDGKTNPYHIETTLSENEIDDLVEELYECGLLKDSNKTVCGGGTVMRAIWEPKWTSTLKLVAYIFNSLLMLLWLPVLIAGIVVFRNNVDIIGSEMAWMGIVIGLAAGIILHEFGHAFAGASYGAKVFEMGLMTMWYVVPGAYVILDEKNVRKRMKRVQIYAAGVEVNLLLTGIFLILCAIFEDYGGMFLNAAIQNAFLAALNLTLIQGFDGMSIMSELLGTEDASTIAADVIFNSEKKKSLKKHGIAGSTTIAACYMLCAFRIALPVLLILNVLEVVVCFI